MADMLTSSGLGFQEIAFSTPLSTWTINHNFGFNPNVEVQVYVDDVLTKIYPHTMTYPTVNTVEITWTTPQKGFALVAA